MSAGAYDFSARRAGVAGASLWVLGLAVASVTRAGASLRVLELSVASVTRAGASPRAAGSADALQAWAKTPKAAASD